MSNKWLSVCFGVALLMLAAGASAEKKYGPGASDTEIKIGNTMPYSGSLSAYGTIGRGIAAYFRMINDQGGVNGRKIKFISLDDGYNPARTVEQVRKLVEEEEVLLLFQTLGTSPNSAIHKYVNAKKVPHLFLATGATKWSDPEHFPWTIGFSPNYQTEMHAMARYLLKAKPEAKVAVLYQNDDYGKDLLKGLRDGLGAAAGKMLLKEVSYEATDPTVDSQIVTLQASGADVLFILATPKSTAQAIRKTYDVGWKPLVILSAVSSSVSSVLTPAGLDKSVGIVTASYLKDPTDPQWEKDPVMREYFFWMGKYFPEGEPKDVLNVSAYAVSQVLVQTLKQCGDDLSRQNVMRQAANLKNFEARGLLPGVRVNTSPSDFSPIKQFQLARFDGKRWVLFGEVMSK